MIVFADSFDTTQNLLASYGLGLHDETQQFEAFCLPLGDRDNLWRTVRVWSRNNRLARPKQVIARAPKERIESLREHYDIHDHSPFGE